MVTSEEMEIATLELAKKVKAIQIDKLVSLASEVDSWQLKLFKWKKERGL